MPTSRPVPQQHWERILITARTYPAPSTKDIEVSCTAGITSDGEWIRLFPVPYRFLESDKRFAKYQEIECLIHKAKTDSRPESHRVNVESIKILSERLSTADRWAERRRRVEPLEAHCMCCVQKRQQQYGSPTLGFIKPAEIIKLSIEPTRASGPKQRSRNFGSTVFGRRRRSKSSKKSRSCSNTTGAVPTRNATATHNPVRTGRWRKLIALGATSIVAIGRASSVSGSKTK